MNIDQKYDSVDYIDDLESLALYIEVLLEENADESEEFKLAVYESSLFDILRAIRKMETLL